MNCQKHAPDDCVLTVPPVIPFSCANRLRYVVVDNRSGKEAAVEVLRRFLLEKGVILRDHKIASEYRDVTLQPAHLTATGRSERSVLSLIESLEGLAESVPGISKPRPGF